jgi:hypothetical protein
MICCGRSTRLFEVRRHLRAYIGVSGGPSIDLEQMIRILIGGHGFGIRSDRRVCEEVDLNVAYP